MSPSSYRGMSNLYTDSHFDYQNESYNEEYSSYRERRDSNPYMTSNHDINGTGNEYHSYYNTEREGTYSGFRDFRTPTHSSSYGVRNSGTFHSMSPLGRGSPHFRSDFNDESVIRLKYASDYASPPPPLECTDSRSNPTLPGIMTNMPSNRGYRGFSEREHRDDFYSQSPSYHFSSINRNGYENDTPTSRYDRSGSLTDNGSGYYHMMSASPHHGLSVGSTPRNGMNNQGLIDSSHDGYFAKNIVTALLSSRGYSAEKRMDNLHNDYITCLRKSRVYRDILANYDTQQYLSHKNTTLTPSEEESIRKRIDDGIEKKKNCQFLKARTVFIELVLEYPHCLQIWLEFTRLEMECGEYNNAAMVLDAALLQHNHNELLLQKKIRVEERLNHIKPIINIIKELKTVDTQKSLKIIMEAIAVIARMGYERRAMIFYRKIVQVSRFFTGNFFMELMLFEEHYGDYEKLLRMIPIALEKYPKYGPLWFYCFELEEHDCMTKWTRHDLNSRVSFNRYEEYMKKAVSCLTSDLLWKVYLIRIQFWYRSILYLRAVTLKEVGVSIDYHLSSLF